MKRAFLAAISITLLAACSPSAGGKSTATPDHWPLEKVRLSLGYLANVQFAPVYVAADKGYFQEEGLEVELDHRFIEVDNVALVGAGELPFAIVSGDQVPLARAQGLPVVYVMAWWHGYPVAVAALEESGIRTAADLKGKDVGIPMLSGASYVGFRALINAAGVKEDEVTLEITGPGNQVEALTTGKVDAAVVYANNEPVQLAERGYKVNVIRVADYVDLASNGLMTSEKMLAEDPELVRSMIRAFLRGVQDVIGDPDGAYQICRKYVEGLAENDPVQKKVLFETIEFWKTDRPGTSDLDAWRNMESVLRSAGLLAGELDVRQAFTNDYLPK
jgi:NitT/TauT family transport system substrate-binding protein